MRNFPKSIIIGVMALCFLALAGEASAFCYPVTFGGRSGYPIYIVNPNGSIWKGDIRPGTSTAAVYNADGTILGTYPISNKTSSTSCVTTGWAKFKVSAAGDDGNTWVTLKVESGVENWSNSVLWFGNTFTRTKYN